MRRGHSMNNDSPINQSLDTALLAEEELILPVSQRPYRTTNQPNHSKRQSSLSHEDDDLPSFQSNKQSFKVLSNGQLIRQIGKFLCCCITFLLLFWIWFMLYFIDFLPEVCHIDQSIKQSNVNEVYHNLAIKHFERRNLTSLKNHSITLSDVNLVHQSYRNIARFRWNANKSDRLCLFTWCSYVRVRYVDLEGNEHTHMPVMQHSNRVKSQWEMLQNMVDMWDPNDLPEYMDMLLNISDDDEYFPVDERVPLPILFSSTSKSTWRSIPFVYFISWFSLFDQMDKNVRRALSKNRSKTPHLIAYDGCVTFDVMSNDEWNKLKPQAYWRGSTTGSAGGLWTPDNFQMFDRFKLANISLHHSSIIDARVTKCTQCDPEQVVEKALHNTLGDHFGTRLSEYDDLLQYQGLIDVDGNTWSARAPQLMSTGAIVFKQKSPFYEFWSELTHENIHFIPIETDLSDLVDRVTDVLNRPDSKEIGHRSQQFVHEYLSRSSVFLYAQHVLKLYAQLLQHPSKEIS